MDNCKYLWTVAKTAWKYALDFTATIFVILALIAYIVVPNYGLVVASLISNLLPILIAILWTAVVVITIFRMFLKASERYKRKLLWQSLFIFFLSIAFFLTILDTCFAQWFPAKIVAGIITLILIIVSFSAVIKSKEQLTLKKAD
jgi:asparagine N-glycosylation enzyme membrane subunit Stt3